MSGMRDGFGVTPAILRATTPGMTTLNLTAFPAFDVAGTVRQFDGGLPTDFREFDAFLSALPPVPGAVVAFHRTDRSVDAPEPVITAADGVFRQRGFEVGGRFVAEATAPGLVGAHWWVSCSAASSAKRFPTVDQRRSPTTGAIGSMDCSCCCNRREGGGRLVVGHDKWHSSIALFDTPDGVVAAATSVSRMIPAFPGTTWNGSWRLRRRPANGSRGRVTGADSGHGPGPTIG